MLLLLFVFFFLSFLLSCIFCCENFSRILKSKEEKWMERVLFLGVTRRGAIGQIVAMTAPSAADGIVEHYQLSYAETPFSPQKLGIKIATEDYRVICAKRNPPNFTRMRVVSRTRRAHILNMPSSICIRLQCCNLDTFCAAYLQVAS